MDKLGLQSLSFPQDNDPKNTAKVVQEWLLYHTSQSADFNPEFKSE